MSTNLFVVTQSSESLTAWSFGTVKKNAISIHGVRFSFGRALGVSGFSSGKGTHPLTFRLARCAANRYFVERKTGPSLVAGQCHQDVQVQRPHLPAPQPV